MNSTLKRMFEDDDCSIEEAKLKAAILGKSYEECKKDWELQFKKEFILANANVILNWNYHADINRKHWFKLVTYKIDDLKSKIFKCDNVTFDDATNRRSEFNLGFGPVYITVSFYEHELDKMFLNEIEKKIRKYTEL